ncbi:MAG TPA: hypothetical protein VL614_00625 [Acetobacteraceae bacterium]|jgi:hypothetical protein|nr:hypothetical protein [Acetobacteraceae bacterium]
MSLVGKRPDLGFLTTPRRRQVFDLLAGTWAADTGCYTGTYDEGLYLEFLRRRHYAASTCLFAPAPDVVGDPVATWRLSEPVLAKIRDAGFRAALVAQDGLRDPPWDAFDVLFIGGTTRFKLSHQARELVAGALARGKGVHMGRVNSEVRLRTAAMWGCASADGNFLATAPDINERRMLRWLDRIAQQPQMVFG